jgi:2-C-methyl-D-erythritol 2,4-cyclodiphosphate synthase
VSEERRSEYRVGTGFDAHAFADDVPLVLGGVRLEHPRGLAGHSDGDVLAHALTDALLGAAGMEDIGALFPSEDPALARADSVELLRQAWAGIDAAGWELVNADVVLIGEEPRLAPHRDAIRERLSGALGVEPQQVAVRATTTDGLGFTGRREGLAAQAVALLRRRDSG